MSLLEVENLRVEFPTGRGAPVAAHGVSFAIEEGGALPPALPGPRWPLP